MKVIYTLSVRSGIGIPFASGTPGLNVGKIAVEFKSDGQGNLEAVALERNGVELSYTKDGSIVPVTAELQEEAYRAATYIANRLYVQTSLDAIDPQVVLLKAPQVFPENSKEEAVFKTIHRGMGTSVQLDALIQRTFDPSSYATGFEYSVAHGYYADAKRVSSPFQKFELLYKVVEYFFSENGTALDAAVSAYTVVYDSTFTPNVVKDLRLLRNRSVHPRASRGHINPENVRSMKKVRAGIPSLDRLVELLLEHPTF